jgi:hypothetical protein
MYFCPGDTSPLRLLATAEGGGHHRDPFISPGTRPMALWRAYELEQRMIAACRRIGAPLPVYLTEDNAGILAAIAEVLAEPIGIEDIATGKPEAIDLVEEVIASGIDDPAISPDQSIFGE